MTVGLLPELASVFLLMFMRIGTMVMLMPALGEAAVPTRVRLAAALTITVVLYPFAREFYAPASFASGPKLIFLAASELVVGFGLGLVSRLVLSSLNVAGNVIAIQLGLGYAQTLDPMQGEQSALVATFLSVAGMTLIFATDLHHLFIAALGLSYQHFRPGELPATGDLAQLAIQTISGAFSIGLQISAPFLVFGLIFYVGLGVLSRLMPQLQIFFIAVPASIIFGFLILALVLGTMLSWFLGDVEASATRLLGR